MVRAGGTVLAESDRPVVVLETGFPARCYLPEDDVRVPLEPSSTTTFCPYKGTASYAGVDGHDDVAWSYPEPFDETRAAAGLWCFDDGAEGITVEVTP